MDGYLLGIDIGTYESKAVLVTTTGEVAANVAVGHALSLPQPGWVEHDADQVWWHDCVHLCREIVHKSGIDPRRILGIGTSSIGPCVLPIDASGKALRPAILYGIDTRAQAEVVELEAILGREVVFNSCGQHLSSQAAGPKILWLHRHEPEVWARTATILTGSGYLAFKLTGERTIDVYTATAYAPLLDVRTAHWSAAMAEPIAPLSMLPRLAWSGEVIGRVMAEAAAQTGLVAGTPVVAGTADAASEALSAGMCASGDLMVMYGSSVFFIQQTSRLVTTERLWAALFLEPGTYAVAGGMSTTGSLTRWFRDNLAPTELAAEKAGGTNAYDALADLAASSPPGAWGLVLLPYFAGERTPLNDPLARGVLAGLTLSHTRADIYRAVLESVAYGIRHNIEAMHEEGVAPQRILAVGGGTRNPIWLQIVSDVAGIEQHVPEKQHGACYGDAFLAAVGLGLYPGISHVTEWVRPKQVVRPDQAVHEIYQPYYEIYRELYTSSASAVHRLAQLGQGAAS
ncbi:MAG: FGGY-family carbohydrate kinase [Anaerolineae bacterium]